MSEEIRALVAAELPGWTELPNLPGFSRVVGGCWLIGGISPSWRQYVKHTGMAPDGPDTPNDPVVAARWLFVHAGGDVSQLELGAELLADAGEEEQDSGHGDAISTEPGAESLAEHNLSAGGNDGGSDHQEGDGGSLGETGGEAGVGDQGADDAGDPDPAPLQAELAPEPEAFAGTTILGADPLDRIRSQRIGDVARIAAGKIAERRAAASYTLAEYQELQGYVMSHTDAVGAFKGDDERYQRFVALADCQRAVNDLGAYRDGLTETLLEASREAVEAFDPAQGWPV